MIRRAVNWFDDRLGMSGFARKSLNKIFPDNWSFMLGEVALYCFIILVLTGTYLTFFFSPSAKDVTYQGSYVPLHGVHMSQAYESTVHISFDVRAGLVMRQMHHWAALLFLAAIILHLCRIFFTGAFRKPRELNWLIGLTLFVLALFNGFSGYSLPDDLLSGTGLRIAYSIALAVPVIGTWAAFLVFGGEFPADDITSRLFIMHVLLVPALIATLLGAHLAVLWHQKHTQFPGPGRREDNIVGSRLWPTYALRSVGLFAGVAACIALLAGLAQINPVWLYGPFKAPAVSTAAQPDWYMGWLEGALRLFPPWRIHLFGYTISELFWPGVVLPGVTFGLLYLWPFLEAKVTRDHDPHHLLDRPRDRPVRTAIGIAALTFYGVLMIAGSQDLIAERLGAPISSVTTTLRVLVLALPVAAALITWRLCHDLQRSDQTRATKRRIRAEHFGLPLVEPEVTGSKGTKGEASSPPGWLAKAIGAVAVVAAGVAGLRARRRDRAGR